MVAHVKTANGRQTPAQIVERIRKQVFSKHGVVVRAEPQDALARLVDVTEAMGQRCFDAGRNFQKLRFQQTKKPTKPKMGAADVVFDEIEALGPVAKNNLVQSIMRWAEEQEWYDAM